MNCDQCNAKGYTYQGLVDHKAFTHGTPPTGPDSDIQRRIDAAVAAKQEECAKILDMVALHANVSAVWQAATAAAAAIRASGAQE